MLFVDADVLYDSRCLAGIVTLLETRGADLLTVLPRFASEGFWENVLMPFVLESYSLGPGFLANRDRPRWLAVGGGAGNLIRREVYDAVGGHEALRDSVIDDVHLALKVKRAGFRALVSRAEDRVRVRMYRGFREVCDGFTKNLAYAFNGALGVLLFAAAALNLLVGIAPIAIVRLLCWERRFPVPISSSRSPHTACRFSRASSWRGLSRVRSGRPGRTLSRPPSGRVSSAVPSTIGSSGGV